MGIRSRRQFGTVAGAVLVLLAVAGAALTTAQSAQAAICSAAAVTVTPMHSPDGTQRPFYADFGNGSTNHSGYAGYELSGASLGSDVWIKLSGFTGGKLGLAANQSASIPARATSQAGKPLVYAYLTATAATTSAQTFAVEVWNGKPGQTGSSQVCTTTDGFSAVEDVIKAAANKITSISVSNSSPAIGGAFDVTAAGDTGQMGVGIASDRSGGNGVFAMAPAMGDSWPADAFTLTGVRSTLAGTTYRDRLRVYPGAAAEGAYTSRYDFTVRTTTSGATQVLPVQSIASGTQVKYTGTYPGVISQISAPALTMSLVKTALSITGPPYKVAYQVLVSNSAASPVTLDYLRDTPTPAGPASWAFEAGSAKLGGSAISDPTLDAGALVFSGPFSVPANSSLFFTYTLAVSTTITNSVVGVVGGLEIGASSGSGNQVSVDPTAPSVTTVTLPNANVGSSYSQALAATAGTGTYTWSVTSGSLPAGLTLAPATGVISGIATGVGTATFTVTATDGTPKSGSKSLTLTVDGAVVADTTAPTGSLTLNGGAAATSSATLTLGLGATDGTGVVAYRVAQGSDCTSASWVPVTSALSFSGSASLTVSAGDGVKTVCAQYKDAAGNVSTASTQTITLDTVAPTVVLASAAPSSVTGAFTVTATFSESVTSFSAADVTVGNGVLSAFAGSGASYSFTIAPAGDGTVTVDVAANGAADAAGNLNTAATQLTRTADISSPSVSLTTGAPGSINGAFVVTATFSKPVTGFDAGDVAVANGAVSGFSGSGAVYTFTVTPAADGAVTVDVGPGAGADTAANASTAAAQLALTADVTPPSVSLSTAAPSSTNGSFVVTATFSEPVTGFGALDVAVTNGAVSGFSGSGTTYTFTVTPTGAGSVEVAVGVGAASEGAGNGNVAAVPLGRVYDPVAPVVTVSGGPGATSVVGSATFVFAADELVAFSCSLDAAAFGPCSSPVVLTGLAAGEHTLVIRPLDLAGNTSDTTYTWTVAAPSGGSSSRVPQPHLVIMAKINPTDMLGRPTSFKQSADGPHSPGPFTRKLQVKLHIPTPTGEGIDVDDVFISNYPDFRDSHRYAIAADELYDWELLAGPSGDRPVYLRFDDSPDTLVGEATIVLDQELPTLRPALMRTGLNVSRRLKAAAAAHPVYCGAARRRWLRIPGVDGFSGLNAVQIATDIRHPCGWRPYLPVISYRAPGKVIYLRIEDRVGNVSRWYRTVTR